MVRQFIFFRGAPPSISSLLCQDPCESSPCESSPCESARIGIVLGIGIVLVSDSHRDEGSSAFSRDSVFPRPLRHRLHHERSRLIRSYSCLGLSLFLPGRIVFPFCLAALSAPHNVHSFCGGERVTNQSGKKTKANGERGTTRSSKKSGSDWERSRRNRRPRGDQQDF